MSEPENSPRGGAAVFRFASFRHYEMARLLIVLSTEMQSVAVGWQLYDITKRPMSLGFAGLAQFLPLILLFLVSGHVADRMDRKRMLMVCYAAFAVCSGLLFVLGARGIRTAGPIYAVLVLVGVVRAFNGPAVRALLPHVAPGEYFASAVAWNATVFQAATILGPALGGLIYAFARGPAAVYATAMCGGCAAAAIVAGISVRERVRETQPATWQTVMAGLRFIHREKLILGSISLDLFAVLLGGAVALLPVYAREILKTGPWGLGLLRSAPGLGAAVMAVLLAYRPLRRRAGATMLWCVAAFGVFTIVFGLSRNIAVSMAALVLVGAADMVSVVIRATLVQVGTPDAMRGRVNAVDMIFVGASNEFGEFESGITAQWLGTVPAVVLGGIGAILVTALWAWKFPDLRRADRLANLED
ncbi:MAG TPA: MFS transporter [Candidatus Acidoferrales bacterium]|nr:MFS transporter [Candidatus Acidoferrales bacterium]